jgi:tight adherence protein C
MILLAIISVVLVGASATLLGWAGALPRKRAVQRLAHINAYGAPAVSADGAGTDTVTPLFDSLARRVGAAFGQTTGSRDEDLRKHLMAAGIYRISPGALVGYRVLAVLAMMALALTLSPPGWPLVLRLVVMAAAGWGGWAIPLVLLKRRARVRLAQIDFALPGMIDLLVVTVEAGMGFSSSLHIAAEKLEGPLGDELRLLLQEQRMGLANRDALHNMAARADTPGVRTFTRAIIQGEQLGVSIGQILRSLAVDMRKLRRSMAEERAQKAPVKMLFPLVFLIFPALFIILLGPALLEVADTLGGRQ